MVSTYQNKIIPLEKNTNKIEGNECINLNIKNRNEGENKQINVE